jgi:hypothetical protein
MEPKKKKKKKQTLQFPLVKGRGLCFDSDENRENRSHRIPPQNQSIRQPMVRLLSSLPNSASHHRRLRAYERHSIHVPGSKLCQRCQNLPRRRKAHTQNRSFHACHWSLGPVCEFHKDTFTTGLGDVALQARLHNRHN